MRECNPRNKASTGLRPHTRFASLRRTKRSRKTSFNPGLLRRSSSQRREAAVGAVSKHPVRQTGDYQIILTTDEKAFGGFGNIDTNVRFPSDQKGDRITMKIYNVSRVATVYQKL